MEVKLSPKVDKYIKGLNEPIKSRINNGLEKLESNPPRGDIKALSNKDRFRLRVGGYRILFDIIGQSIYVHEIGPRGQIYKKR